MSEVTNEQLADVFRKAKRHLRGPTPTKYWRTQYICAAIGDCRSVPQPVRNAARAEISKRLGPNHGTVSQWLTYKGYLNECIGMPMDDAIAQVQAYRHRWLDALIAEYSA